MPTGEHRPGTTQQWEKPAMPPLRPLRSKWTWEELDALPDYMLHQLGLWRHPGPKPKILGEQLRRQLRAMRGDKSTAKKKWNFR